jgi:lactate permease
MSFPVWTQNYNPLGNALFSTIAAAVPAAVLLASITVFKVRIHFAALLGLVLALIVSIFIYGMPAAAAAASSLYGAAFGLFPIGWILLNVIFIYQLTVKRGLFEVLRHNLATIAPDPRIQVILIAFAFGAFLEGMAGFGAPVAITATILVQLGFRPIQACVLTLIANTAPVAFGTLGIPIATLAEVTGIDSRVLSAVVGKQLALFSLMIPFWVVITMAGWRGVKGVWPAALTAGVAFTVPEYVLSVYHGPWLVGPISGLSAILALTALLRFWRPATLWSFDAAGNLGPRPVEDAATRATADQPGASAAPSTGGAAVAAPELTPKLATVLYSRKTIFQAWLPWLILTLFILAWGMPQLGSWLDNHCLLKVPIPYLHQCVQRMPPVVLADAPPEKAILKLNLLSATGTGIFFAAILSAFAMGLSLREMLATYVKTIWQIRLSLLTIATMLALGTLTKYSGTDATLGLALAHTGSFYPFFGTLLGWLGVALTGSDTSSNVLFGSLQKITAQQIGVNPVLMAAANSSGGVMGKMMSAQSIVIATTATNCYGNEGRILKRLFFHSVALVVIMAIWVYLQAYVPLFMRLVAP